MTSKIIELIKNGSLYIPKLLIKNYKKLKITDQELILIIYLMDNNEFDPERISNDLELKMPETLKLVDELVKKDILKFEMTKSKICEEKLNLDELYNKLALLIMEEKTVTNQTNIYDEFEKEFGRTLSPMEFEIIGAWVEADFTEELILLALKEATYNGVSNLRYIDKILYEWQKKGVKTKEDIDKERKKFTTKKESSKEVFDYDWLNE